jgi:hypothetical protein
MVFIYSYKKEGFDIPDKWRKGSSSQESEAILLNPYLDDWFWQEARAIEGVLATLQYN